TLEATLVRTFIYVEEEERSACGVWLTHCLPGLDGRHGCETGLARAVFALLARLRSCFELQHQQADTPVTKVRCSVVSRAAWLDIDWPCRDLACWQMEPPCRELSAANNPTECSRWKEHL
ncbi:hypothetical protein P7K49_020980, partial [Saguinus oedipus]